MRLLVLTLMLTAATGCGGSNSSTGAPPPPGGPLTVDAWKGLPTDEKYSANAIERLKAGDPKLATPEGWEAFSKTTLAQEKKKDPPKPKK